MKRTIHHFKSVVASSLTVIILGSCSDLIEVDPPKTQIVTATVFTDDRTAISAISGIYSTMATSGSFASGSSGSLTMLAGLSSDEYQNLSNTPSSLEFSNNTLTPVNTGISSTWSSLYETIYFANSVLEGLDQSTSLTGSVKQQIEGEALFIRAFSHFYLINLFGEVPLVTSTDYRINSITVRETIDKVYLQIIDDLIHASEMMNEDYAHASGERVRPNRYTALALLARVYLYQGQWQLAATTSSQVIQATSLYQLESNLNNVFLKTSREAIWQLKPVQPESNTNEAPVFQSLSFVSMSEDLNNEFEDDDQRYQQWSAMLSIGANSYRVPFKYKIGVSGEPLTEYSMVIRLAELYLIRAEAQAQLSQLEGAVSDLNAIRSRADLPEQNLSSQSDILEAIAVERRLELFSEWGHRWFDLKRTHKVDQVLGTLKQTWKPEYALYPLPKSERDNNPKLSQNQGY